MLPGNKKLGQPRVSQSITFNGEEVLSIVGQGRLYIFTMDDMLQSSEPQGADVIQIESEPESQPEETPPVVQ